MKKTISIFLSILILMPSLLFLSSCNSFEDDMPEDILVWAIPSLDFPDIPLDTHIPGAPLVAEWERAVARAIRERGGDFGVQIMPVGNIFNFMSSVNPHDGLNYPWFTELMIDEVNRGTQIDIAFVSSNGFTDAYFEMYQAGLTLPLDDFLHSDQGQEVFAKFPPAVWDALRINGEIRGFLGHDNIGHRAAFSINKELAEQIDTSLLTNDLGEFVDRFLEDHDVVLNRGWFSSLRYAPFFSMFEILPNFMLSDGQVMSFFEHYLIESLIRALHAIPATYHSTGSFSESINANIELVTTTRGEDVFLEDSITIPIGEPMVNSLNSAITINPNSEYIDQALQLLTWLQTDKEFANIFFYGEEGVHVVYEDGMMFCLHDHERIIRSLPTSFGTTFIATPPFLGDWVDLRGEAEANMAYLWTLESASHTGFRFDRRGWEEKISQLEEIVHYHTIIVCPEWYNNRKLFADTFPELFPGYPNDPAVYVPSPLALGTDSDWETTLASLNTDLRAAGIGELIEEVQRQYDEWFALHSPVNR